MDSLTSRWVGLLVEPGPGLLVSMLGILKSGRGFVPLDPEFPAERLALMVEDCEIGTLITEERLLDRASELARRCTCLRDVVCLDAEPLRKAGKVATGSACFHGPRRIAEAPAPVRSPAIDTESPAYVIYTSGSTGRPKGVPITHGNLVPLLAWSREALGLGEHTRVLQSLSHSFDFGVFEILTTLFFGGTLFSQDRSERSDPESFAASAAAHAVNTLHATPAFFREVAVSGGAFPQLRTLHLGGEALGEALVEQAWTTAGDDCEVYNGYGPTEATINCSLFRIGRRAERRHRGSTSIPIGRPSALHRLMVLGPEGRLIPIGAPGELVIGGPSVSSGYYRRPRLSAEKFIPNPFAERFGEAGSRLYRTGDLARFRGDGEIEFLGRIDHQVKIRGYRIEPEEIAAVLSGQPEIREAVVVPRPTTGGQRRLVAYLVPRPDARSGLAERARRHLRDCLPPYMVPSAFVEVPAFPRTPNGKLDAKALPEPATEAETPYRAPSGPLEEVLAGIWAEVLGLERVGADDDFFELGGHSLSATRVVSRVRRALETELALRQVFEHPTVSGLARALETADAGKSFEVPPLVPTERAAPLPPSFAQERLWILDRLDPGSSAYVIPAAVRLSGAVEVSALEWAFAELVRRHEVLRTTFEETEDGPRQLIHGLSEFALPVIDLGSLPKPRRSAESTRVLGSESRRGFELSRGPLLRARILVLGARERVLFLSLHHIVSDGWSTGILIRELSALYEAAVAGASSPLPVLGTQYADYAVWQRSWLRGELLEGQLAYWRERLSDLPSLELPTDRPRPAVARAAGGSIAWSIPEPLATDLRSLARAEGSTLFTVLLAGFAAVLGRLAGQQDLAVGSPVAGRGRLETEGLIGFFVNTLVLRTDLSGAPTFAELVGRLRRVTLEAFAHQDVPFERLVEDLRPERRLDATPLFQVLLALQNAPFERAELPGLELSGEALPQVSTKFDFELLVEEHDPLAPISGLVGRFLYRRDLFDETTVLRMAGSLRRALAAGVADPGRCLEALDLLSPAERQQLEVEWNGAPHAIPSSALPFFEELVAGRASETPDRAAVVGSGEVLSFGGLTDYAGRLAACLRSLGVGEETRVALLLERRPRTVGAILGVLEAGGAWVPLDPASPFERLGFQVADAEAALVLTEGRLASLLPETSARVVDLDRLELGLAAPPRPRRRSPSQLAYVIYTSGSTGRPKGVGVSRGSLAHLIRAWKRRSTEPEWTRGGSAGTRPSPSTPR